jgi:hypothetical protein
MRLRAAAANKALDIGTAWKLLDESADVIEKIFNGLDCETECPCCQENTECLEGCTFSTDSYDGYGRMQFFRELLTHNGVFSGTPSGGSAGKQG